MRRRLSGRFDPAEAPIRPIDGGGGGDGGGSDPRPNPDLLAAHRAGATWSLAVEAGLEAAPLIVQSGLPVMAIGGFQGRDPAIDVDGFGYRVREGRIRFASAGQTFEDPGAGPAAAAVAADLVLDWVVATCARVDRFETLYDCQGRG